MKKNILKQFTCVVAAATALCACDDFLDKQPSVTTDAPITEAAQLLSLYDEVSNTYEYAYEDAYGTDDYGLPMAMYDAKPNQFKYSEMCFYTLNSKVMEGSSSNMGWQREYAKVFTANTMIENAPTSNGTESEKHEALANGYFMRAWSFFRMATVYCKAYSETNREELGLSLRLGTLFTEDITRATLGATFDQILADLTEAEKYCTTDRVVAGLPWRTSKCAIYGLYARIYLYMNDYEKAASYADQALALSQPLFDYNNLTWGAPVSYPAKGTMPAQKLEYSETHSWNVKSIFNEYTEWAFVRLHNLGTQWYSPSQELLDTYTEKDTDLRFIHFMVEHGNRRFSVPYDWYRYNQFNDGRYCVSGLTTAEFYLVKAECQARTGDWQNALNTLQPLREARFTAGTATTLTATSQDEALKQVLMERRRELPFSVRMMDIKRFATSASAVDDVTINREFYVVTESGIESQTEMITVKGDDARYAIPIPIQDINNADGMLVQNPFN